MSYRHPALPGYVRSFLVAGLLALGLALPATALALGEQTGSITGVIEEFRVHLPLAGVQVRLISTTTGGGPSLTQSDEAGRFRLTAVPPGEYELLLSIEGATPLRRRVYVRPGEQQQLDIAWNVEGESEKQVIKEVEQPTRSDTTRTGGVLSAQTMSKLPSLRFVEDLALQIPGVGDPYQTFLRPVFKGGLGFGNRFLIDGLDVSDPVSGTGTSDINFDAISDIEVITGGMEAEYNTLGGVLNVTTKNAGPRFSVDASFYAQHQALGVQERVGTGPQNGARPFARGALYASQSYTGNINLGVPLVADKLWLHTSLQYGFSELYLPQGPPFQVQHPSNVINNLVAHAKLTWAPNPRHRINFSVRTGYLGVDNLTQSNSLLAPAENALRQSSTVAALRWDALLSSHARLVTHASFQYLSIDNVPQGWVSSVPDYDLEAMRHENFDDGTSWYQGSLVKQTRRYVAQLDPALEIYGQFLGQHTLKFGVQTRYLSDQRHVELPGGTLYLDQNGGAGEAGLCQPASRRDRGCSGRLVLEPNDSAATGLAAGVFLQDRWRLFKRLTLLPGVRFDYGMTKNALGEEVTAQWAVVPRVGFTLDLRGDQATVLTGFYGRATDTASLLPATMAQPTGRNQLYLYDRASKTWALERTLGGPGGYLLDAQAAPPAVDEVTVSVRQNLFRVVTGVVDYTYRHLTSLWDQEEQNRIWDPSGTWVAGYKNGQRQDIYYFTTRPENERTYHGVDASLGAQHQGFEIFAAYTLSWLYGTTQDAFGQLYGNPGSSPHHNPCLGVYARGYLPEDSRHQLRLRASYLTHGVNIGVTFYYGTGTPVTPRYFNSADADYSLLRAPVGLAPGSDRNDPAQFSELRNPDRILANARLSWDLQPLIRQQLLLMVDVFNLFNQRTPLALESRDLPTFGQSTNRLLPLYVRLGVRYVY